MRDETMRYEIKKRWNHERMKIRWRIRDSWEPFCVLAKKQVNRYLLASCDSERLTPKMLNIVVQVNNLKIWPASTSALSSLSLICDISIFSWYLVSQLAHAHLCDFRYHRICLDVWCIIICMTMPDVAQKEDLHPVIVCLHPFFPHFFGGEKGGWAV